MIYYILQSANKWKKRGISIVPTIRGIGISIPHDGMMQAGALVHVYTDGTVLLAHGGVEMGQVDCLLNVVKGAACVYYLAFSFLPGSSYQNGTGLFSSQPWILMSIPMVVIQWTTQLVYVIS